MMNLIIHDDHTLAEFGLLCATLFSYKCYDMLFARLPQVHHDNKKVPAHDKQSNIHCFTQYQRYHYGMTVISLARRISKEVLLLEIGWFLHPHRIKIF